MWPTLLEIGPLPIHTYGTLIAIGFLTALHFIQRDARRAKLDAEVIGNAAFWTLLIGVAGTRVLHIIMFPENYSITDPIGWVALWNGGLVFQGGPPPAIAFLYFYFRKHGVPFWKVVDVAVPYLPLGQAFGRLGCFAYGCCYGKPTEVAWGISFPRFPKDTGLEAHGSPAYIDHAYHQHLITPDAAHSLAIHPTQLYASFGLFALVALLLIIRKHFRSFEAVTLPWYLMLYGVFRFIVEFFRGDHNPTIADALSMQQVFSIGFAICGLILYFVLRRRKDLLPNPE